MVAPLGHMFKNKLKEYIRAELSENNFGNMDFFDSKYVGEILNDHFRGRSDNGFKIFALLIFKKWNDIFMCGKNSQSLRLRSAV